MAVKFELECGKLAKDYFKEETMKRWRKYIIKLPLLFKFGVHN